MEDEICQYSSGTGKVKTSIYAWIRDFLDEDNCLEINGVSHEFKFDQNSNPCEMSTTREYEIDGETWNHPIHFSRNQIAEELVKEREAGHILFYREIQKGCLERMTLSCYSDERGEHLYGDISHSEVIGKINSWEKDEDIWVR